MELDLQPSRYASFGHLAVMINRPVCYWWPDADTSDRGRVSSTEYNNVLLSNACSRDYQVKTVYNVESGELYCSQCATIELFTFLIESHCPH